MAKGYTLEELQGTPTKSKGFTLEELQGSTQSPPAPDSGVLGSGLKAGRQALGNLPKSAWNFAVGIKDVITNPVDTVSGIGKIGLGAVAKAIPGVQAEEENFNQVGKFLKDRYGSMEALEKTATEDPFAFGADVLGLIQGGASLAGKTAQVNNALSKVAQVATKPVTKTASGIANMATGGAKFGVSQATGLNKETIAEILKNPQKFKEINPELRQQTAQEVAKALDSRLDELSDLGSNYKPIREAMTPVSIPQGTLEGVLAKYGVKLDDNRRIVTSSESRPLTGTDKTALQDFIDNYGSQNEYTSNSFLNTREALSNLSRYEAGKTGLPQQIARDLRKQYDSFGKDQIPGLKDLDTEFAPERELLSQLKKDIFDPKGNLKDTAISKIANLTGKGKEKVLERVKQILPDIEDRVNLVKAIEDIERANGFKTGTYIRGAVTGGAMLTGNIPAIIASILSQPNIAVPLLKGAGYTGQKARPILEGVKQIANDVNNFRIPAPILEYAENPKMGMSIEDVSKSGKVGNVVTNRRNKAGIKNLSDVYRGGGEYKHWTDNITENDSMRDLQSLDDVKKQIATDQAKNPDYEFRHIKNKDGSYSILYKENSIPKDLEPLAQEARKYKSAEEFVDASRKIKMSELGISEDVVSETIFKDVKFGDGQAGVVKALTDFYKKAVSQK